MYTEGSPLILPSSVDRKLLVIRGRSGLVMEDFNSGVIENERSFGHDTDDYLRMVIGHQRNTYQDRILGVHEETRRRLLVTLGKEQIEFVEAKPFARNIWVGEYVKLYTPEEAARHAHSGCTALYWATINNRSPEMVVHANNGYFYPATRNDIVIIGNTG